MRRTVLAVLLAVTGAASAPAQDKFADLTPLLPPTANIATVIDVNAIYSSPLAQKENWTTQRPLPFPPTLNNVALASHIDPATLSGGKWQVGVARLQMRLSMDQIAAREKGAVETVAGAPAVLSARNAYFVQFRPGIIGMIQPADRQEVARWVREAGQSIGTVRLSPFLKAAVSGGDWRTQFILAIDLADAVDPDRARQELAAAPAFAGRGGDVAAVAKALGTLQGVKLTLMVTDAIRGELRFELGEPAGPLVPWAKPLLTDFLSRDGASVEALEDWTAGSAGNAVVLRGELPEKGFRRILSLVAPPPPPADPAGADPALVEQIKALATLRYFRSILAYLDDLQKPSRSTQQDFTRFATWYDSFAQKVEQLPTYSVDADVVKYGQATAARLRGIAASLRGDVVDVQRLERSIGVTPYFYATSGWGGRLRPGVWLQTNQAEVQAQQQEAIQRGIQVRQDLMSRIDNDTDAVRRALAERYKGSSGQ